MKDLWSALSLVGVLEGLLLFAGPAVWKRAAAQLHALPDRHLRAVGGAMLVVGLLSLYFVRNT